MKLTDEQRQVFRAAREVYGSNPKRWAKYKRDNGEGGMCLLGVIDYALSGNADALSVDMDYAPLMAEVIESNPVRMEKMISDKEAVIWWSRSPSHTVASFNNSSLTTFEDVCAFLDELIAPEPELRMEEVYAPSEQEPVAVPA